MVCRQPMWSGHKDFTMPVLIAVGAEGRMKAMKGYDDPARTVGMGAFPVLARAEMRDCAVTVIEDGGHGPQLEQPAVFPPALNAFLK